uniref:G/T mismatch-specific thymine DNA glycosylase n=1 Tax=Periophthalmus magnuspinnatus TaxID=409849 RepID=A0A3B3ZII1_9GOBI
QFYQNYHQTYNQNYSQNYSQNQGSPYQPPQTNSQYFKQFSNIQPQTAQNLHHGAEYNVYSNYHPTQNGGQLYMDPNGQQSDRLNQQNMKTENEETTPNGPTTVPGKKKRGRPSKKTPDSAEVSDEQEVQKKKRNLNRFDGLSVEEVMSRTLPDVIEENLDILIIGINPGLLSAYKGHHYPNPGNHFWKCLFLSGLTDKQLNFLDDTSLPQKHGIGFTNMVERTTPGSKDLSSKEIREGGKQLLEKLQKYRPLIAAFNGKGKDTLWNLSSVKKRLGPRCAQFPRAQDKVHFYIKLKELRDGLKGAVQSREVEETHYTFDLQLAKEDARLLAIKEEQVDPEYESYARDLSEPNTDTKR